MNRLLLTVALVVGLVLLLMSWRQSPAAQVLAARDIVGSALVILLSASWCRYCAMMRSDFRHWGVRYVEYDIKRDSRGSKTYDLLGSSGVPIALIGSQRVDGYHPSFVHKLILGLHEQASTLSESGD